MTEYLYLYIPFRLYNCRKNRLLVRSDYLLTPSFNGISVDYVYLLKHSVCNISINLLTMKNFRIRSFYCVNKIDVLGLLSLEDGRMAPWEPCQTKMIAKPRSLSS